MSMANQTKTVIIQGENKSPTFRHRKESARILRKMITIQAISMRLFNPYTLRFTRHDAVKLQLVDNRSWNVYQAEGHEHSRNVKIAA